MKKETMFIVIVLRNIGQKNYICIFTTTCYRGGMSRVLWKNGEGHTYPWRNFKGLILRHSL